MRNRNRAQLHRAAGYANMAANHAAAEARFNFCGLLHSSASDQPFVIVPVDNRRPPFNINSPAP
jgi:hypothetical protein